MDWKDVFDPELSPEQVLCERIPALHRQRLEQYRHFVETSLIFSVHFSDTDQRYTLRLDGDTAAAEAGEMIDFPQATARGQESDWGRAMKLAALLVEPADEQIDRYQGRVAITESIKAEFERFDGVLEILVVDLPDGATPLKLEVILNDYVEPGRTRRAALSVSWSVLDDLAHGRIDPVGAAQMIKVGKDMGLAFDLGGFFMKKFDL